MVQENPAFQSDNNFEFCQARCRTSSESVLYDKEYRSFHKYCYGTRPPSKEADLGLDKAKYEDLYHTKQKQDAKKFRPQTKKMIVQEDEEETLVFLDMEGAANPLEIVDPKHFRDTPIFGMLGRNDDSSSATQTLPGYLLLIFPLIFTLLVGFGFGCFIQSSNTPMLKVKQE